jgi:hypothetical protein
VLDVTPGWLLASAGAVWIAFILWDTFETLVLPRRITRRLRPTRHFYALTWAVWSAIAHRIQSGGRRETYLSFFGPLSLLVLLGVWVASLVVAFAMLATGLRTPLNVEGGGSFADHLYVSGVAFFTLGLGDVVPLAAAGRALVVIESGLGFAYLALVIGYLPVLYQSFARRELHIALLTVRAGAPPTAEGLLRGGEDQAQLTTLFHDWERWSADVLESHVSYPVLCFYRSQHDRQSWLTALTVLLDASALVIVCVEGACSRQARLTFAMARHALVDLTHVLGREPVAPERDRLPAAKLSRLRVHLRAANLHLEGGPGAEQALRELRSLYEPYVTALSTYLMMPVPPWDAGGPPDRATSTWGALVDHEED